MKLVRLVLVVATLVLSVSFIATPLSSTKALSGSDFKPGRIIDDAIFTNKNAMSVTQIQAFLNAKVPTCEVNHAAYNAQNPPPYTCLKDYQENTTTGANNFGQFTNGNPNSIAGGKSAAQIIWDASQQYNINPQVMIVLLQKEQGLVTDTWPLLSQYTKATGYLCPDTAACNSNAGGFSKQVFGAAWQFRNDLNGIDTPGFFSVYGKGWNNIRLNPNASCGTKSVNIVNQATAVLYKYTPYTPNDAALANLNGLGDGCSAYGNRNFWRYFNDWFGSTLVPDYSAQAVGQSPYPSIPQGQKSVAYFSFKNTGTATWYDDISAWSLGQNVTKLATDNPLNRSSIFGTDWRWGPTRAADTFAAVYEADGTTLAANQHVAQPGQIVKFAFNLSTSLGTPTGYYVEGFRPIVEGYGPMNSTGTWLGVTVDKANYSAVPQSQSYYPTIAQGQSAPAFFSYKNNGNVPWYDEVSAWVAGQRPVRLATDSQLNRSSVFGAGWRFGPARPAENFAAVYEADGTTLAANQHVAQPGQIVKFAFNLSTSLTTPSGFYAEGFRPAVEGYGPMNPTGTWIGVTVQKANYSALPVSQSFYPTITKGQSAPAFFSYKNNGNVPWYDEVSAWVAGQRPVRLATDSQLNRSSVFGAGWRFGPARPAENFAAVYEADGTTLAANQHVAQPGQIVKFAFNLSTSLTTPSGFYAEGFRPAVEGYGPMNPTGTWIGVTVQ